MRKKLVIVVMLCLMVSSTVIAGAVVNKDVIGKEHRGIIIRYDGVPRTLRDVNNVVIYPIIINGSTYLPLRALAGILGTDVFWDGPTTTIDLKNPNYQVPSKDKSLIVNAMSLGTKEQPVKIGQYTQRHSSGTLYGGDEFSYDVTVTFNSMIEATAEEVKQANFIYQKDDYKKVNVTVSISNVSYTNTRTPDAFFYINRYFVEFYGTESFDGNIQGSAIRKFPNAIADILQTYADDKKGVGNYPGYTVTGDVIFPYVSVSDDTVAIIKLLNGKIEEKMYLNLED